MTGCLSTTLPEPVSPVRQAELRPVPFWRRREWQIWRNHYLDDTPENRRGAWVQAQEQDDEQATAGTLRCRIALVPDIALGSLQLKTWYQYETGTLLQVRVWDDEGQGLAPMRVRVLQVETSEEQGEWLHRCAFLADN